MDVDLIILGGGLAGAALAVALRRSPLKIALVELKTPQRSAGWDQRIYAYSPANQAFLDQLGVWAHLDHARLQPVSAMHVFGDAGGEIRFSAYDSGLAELAWIGESGLVHEELWQTLKRQHNVQLICPAAPASLQVDAHGVELGLEDGRQLRARLIVGADGRQSWLRQQAGIAATMKPYHERGVVANFSTEQSHHGIAWQWFDGQGILAWLPLPGKRISVVWSAPNGLADELMALDETDFCARVAAAGGNRLGAFELLSPRAAFPLALMRVETVVKERIALIGDAAHAIHPLSGHGINLGFQDAQMLAEVLLATPAWRDLGELSVLRRYARARAEEPFLMQYLTHGLNRLFRHPDPLLARLRNHGMNLGRHLPVLNAALVRYAATSRF